MGADARQPGEMQGELVLERYRTGDNMDKNGDGRIQYVLLEGELTHQDSAIRTEATVSILTVGGAPLELLASSTAEWERGIGAAKMDAWLDQFGDGIELVLSNNDDMALGAIDALAERNMLEGGPMVFGIDGNDNALQEIKNGNLDGSVVNDSYGQAKGILDIARVLAAGGDPEESISGLNGKFFMAPYYKVTSGTVDDEIERRERLDEAHAG